MSEETTVYMNCPGCKKTTECKKTSANPGSDHNVRYTCTECGHTWVVALGGGFDPSQL